MARGRFAPSPTGPLHLGGARTALVAWLAARSAGSSFVLRLEDLDRPRVVPGSAEAIADDLRWLGLDWDEQAAQSDRLPLYEAALAHLSEAGVTFGCTCSRADIARSASAPHASDEGPRYPGTCRPRVPMTDASHKPVTPSGAKDLTGLPGVPDQNARPSVRSIRFRVEPGEVCFDDLIHGSYCQDVSLATGDFVVRRADGIFAYQLVVVVDDIDMRIEQVVRGDDLLSSTPRQLLLYQALDAEPPAYAHVPLILGPDGQRLSKRHGAIAVRDFRDAGTSARKLVGALAASLGLCQDGEEVSPTELLPAFIWQRLRTVSPSPSLDRLIRS
ncbi:MAG TPA: tRNA glutamyl-Q(34) synthetase GluQRS [Chloroflexota bacterium]|jgi:glutamyl-tRNA synthetase|nr:tRNA glutamyl-Q(34) synthetase GluQRS [Chloroflexota bacterium]